MKNLVKLIENEYISLTDRITYQDSARGEIDKNYFIYWKMEKNKTIFNKGNILLVENDEVYSSFKQALEQKYNLKIPKNKLHTDAIKKRVDCSIRQSDMKHY